MSRSVDIENNKSWTEDNLFFCFCFWVEYFGLRRNVFLRSVIMEFFKSDIQQRTSSFTQKVSYCIRLVRLFTRHRDDVSSSLRVILLVSTHSFWVCSYTHGTGCLLVPDRGRGVFWCRTRDGVPSGNGRGMGYLLVSDHGRSTFRYRTGGRVPPGTGPGTGCLLVTDRGRGTFWYRTGDGVPSGTGPGTRYLLVPDQER